MPPLNHAATIMQKCTEALAGVPDERRDEKHVELSATVLLAALAQAPSERSDLVAHFTKACKGAIGGAPDDIAATIAVLPLATHVLAALEAA